LSPINYTPQYQTDTTRVWIKEDILFVTYLSNAEINIDTKKELHRKYTELLQFGSLPMLLRLEDGVTITKEAREFSRKIEDKQPFSACAVLVNRLAYKILANFYARFYRPKKPFRVFDKENEAIEWLQQFIPENSGNITTP
jgi:hypothetical protein